MRNQKIAQILPYLRYFHSIAANRNLGKAALELNVTAPTVTHALHQLEEALGVTLCVRSRSGFELTKEGADLFESTQTIFSEIEKYSEKISGAEQGRGHLLLGVIDDFENPIYEKGIKKITEKFPDGYLSILVLPSEEITKRLLSGDLDIGFGIFSHRNKKLHFLKIGEEHLKYYLAQNHMLNKKNSIGRDSVNGMSSVWIDNESKSKIDIEKSAFKRRENHLLKIRAFTNNVRVAVKLLKTGNYIAPLPDNTSAVKIDGLRELQISRGPRVLKQEAVFNPAVRGSPSREFLLEFLRERSK